MRDAGKPYSAIRLHALSDRCWCVTDARGAIVDRGGLCMRLTKFEAQARVTLWNAAPDPAERRTPVPAGGRDAYYS